MKLINVEINLPVYQATMNVFVKLRTVLTIKYYLLNQYMTTRVITECLSGIHMSVIVRHGRKYINFTISDSAEKFT